MKRLVVFFACFLFAFSVLAKSYSLTSEPWRLQPFDREPDPAWLAYDFDDSSWLAQKQPAQWQMLPEFEWKYGGKMFYRTRFAFKPEPGKSYYLRFNGVFYYADVWLNGQRLGRHTGYFAPFEFEVTGLLRDRNVLAVEVNCPYEESRDQKRHVTGVFGFWDVISWKRNPGGVWREVELVETGPARLHNVWLGTTKIAGDAASIRLFGEMSSLAPGREPYKLTLDLTPENFTGKSFHLEFGLTAEPGENHFLKEFTLDRPELWNTWDRGKPNLYKATLKAEQGGRVADEVSFTTGIRTIKKTCQPGMHREGLCWEFVLNNKPIFIRGNNYAPGDAYLAAALPATYQKDLNLARAASYNMMRVHAHIDRPEFYEAADRAGIMLWQDYPLQGVYAHEQGILDDASGQAPEMVYLLGSHPAVAFWSCQNEPSLLSTNWNVRVMDRKLKKIFEAVDPTRSVNLGSGLVGATEAHLYFGWYIGKADDFTTAWSLPILKGSMSFITELGAQAFPAYEDAIKFMDPDLRKADWPYLEEHYLLQKQNMYRYIPLKPGMDLKTYIDATQDYQARLQKFHIDSIRSHKYRSNWGIITFLFNDANPAITWSVVDYERTPKKPYYAIAQAFQPVYAFARWQFAPYRKGATITLPIFVVNDLLVSYDAQVHAEVTHNGKQVAAKDWTVKLEPDMPAKMIDKLSFKAGAEGDYDLNITLSPPVPEKPVENVTVLKVAQ